VRATEAAFAATLAARDLEAFTRFLAPDAVFVDDPVQRGPAAIVAAWRRYFEGAKAPFSWAPENRRSARFRPAGLEQRAGPGAGRAAHRHIQFSVAA